jgi:hypothetical protein
MDDAALVRRIAIEKLEKKAEELRPQWAWTKAVLDPEYGFMAQYRRVHPQPAEVPADLAAEIERIESRLGELEELSDDEFTDELMAEAAQLEERRTEIDEVIDALAVYSDKDRARAGCIVTIGDDGELSRCCRLGAVADLPGYYRLAVPLLAPGRALDASCNSRRMALARHCRARDLLARRQQDHRYGAEWAAIVRSLRRWPEPSCRFWRCDGPDEVLKNVDHPAPVGQSP